MEYLAVLTLVVCVWIAEASRMVVDLTHPFKANETVYLNIQKPFRLENVFRGEFDTASGRKIWVEMEEFAAATHGGTHMDAPVHFHKGGWTVDQIPVERLIAPACIVDIQQQAQLNRNYQLSVDDLLNYEQQFGRIPRGAVVIMNSGWGKKWPDKTDFLGNPTGDTTKLSFPGFSKEAAEWLVSNRDIYGVGVDTTSLDHGITQDYIVHRTFFSKNLYGLENLANLDKVPQKGASIMSLPMLMKGASGGALRALAVWETDEAIVEINLYSVLIGTSVVVLITALLIRFCGLCDV